MPVTGPIPLPKSGIDSFLDALQQGQDNRYKAALSQQAQGAGNYSQMLANLYGEAYPNGNASNSPNVGSPTGNYQLTAQDKQAIGSQQQGDSYRIPMPQSQQSPQPFDTNSRQARAKSILYQLGAIKETPEEQENREIETAYQKGLNEHQVKKIGELEDVASSGIQSEPSYKQAASIVSSPEWADMRKHSAIPGLELEYYKRVGTPEQRNMIGDFQAHANQFILNSVNKFPQRFTNSDMRFMQNMKISDNDSLEAAQAKLRAAWEYDRIMSERAGLAANMARKERIPVNEAVSRADKMMDIDKLRDEIKDQTKSAPKVKKYINPMTKEIITQDEFDRRGYGKKGMPNE